MFPIMQGQPTFDVLNTLPFAWLKATNVNGNNSNPSSGSAISTWFDLTPNSFDFSQPSGAAQPILTANLQNGLPGVVFSTSHDLIGLNGFLLNLANARFTFYMVAKIATGSENLPLTAVPDDVTNRFNMIVPISSTQNVYLDYGDALSNNRLIVSETDIYLATYAHCFQVNNPTMAIYRNNATLGTNATAGSFTPGAKLPHMGFGFSTGMTVFEMIWYRVAHNAAQRAQIFSYLNNTWKYQ